MAKPEVRTLWSELLSAGLYKRNQGRLTRQVTAGAVALLFLVGAYMMSVGALSASPSGVRVGVPTVVALVGLWLAFRVVNVPRFAEFLISVEAEMSKVAWAGKQELYSSTIVVLSAMFFLGVVLFVYDQIWLVVLSALGVLQV